jgi:transcriptional regulator with XRE-family HTH domain
MPDTSIALEQLIAKRLRALREAKGLRQDQFAHQLRVQCGLPWTQATIADLEAGKRRLSLAEAMFLQQAFPLSALLKADTTIEVLDQKVPADRWNMALPKRIHPLIWADATERDDEWSDPIGAVAASLQAEQRMARKIGVTPTEIANAAVRRWNRGLTEEREDRMRKKVPGKGDKPAQDTDSNRLHRSHITRDLEKEIREQLVLDAGNTRLVNRNIHSKMRDRAHK